MKLSTEGFQVRHMFGDVAYDQVIKSIIGKGPWVAGEVMHDISPFTFDSVNTDSPWDLFQRTTSDIQDRRSSGKMFSSKKGCFFVLAHTLV